MYTGSLITAFSMINEQTTSLTLMKMAKWFLKNVQVFTFTSSFSFYVSLLSNNILCGSCLKLSQILGRIWLNSRNIAF